MKKIIGYVRRYIKEEVRPLYFILLGLFLLLLLAVNYGLDFEQNNIRTVRGKYSLWQVGRYFLFYGLPYFLAVVGYCYFYKKIELLKQPGLWILGSSAVLLASIDTAYNPGFFLAKNYFPPHLRIWALFCLNNLFEALILFIPPFLYWRFVARRPEPLYGVSKKDFQIYPYFLMLLVLAPFIFWASHQPDFQQAYPRYRTTYAAEYLGVSPLIPVLIFQLFYGLAFVAVEFFYRGFLVLGFRPYLGAGAIPAMAVIYCMIHFRKPFVEAASSIFGGLLLGIIVYYGRSILGGIIVHLGIAWLMELAGFYQLYLTK